ncbi:hypothetical protein [Cellvibrio sp.]|uniref:hypothetical protein n=1 Tax=Cellvibrio sp. TaxID=1965322 RepID=UPI0039647B0B
MKYLLFAIFFAQLAFAEAGDKEHFLKSWEEMQSKSGAFETFTKVSDSEYNVKFKTIPYEGTLKILVSDVQESPSYGNADGFSKMGYVEVDLPGAPADLTEKYSRTYYKWAQNNTLYYNSKTATWVDATEYSKSFKNKEGSFGFKLWTSVLEYWSYILILIVLYFLWSTIVNNLRTKNALKNQEEAIKKSLQLSEQSLQIQSQAIQSSSEAHQRTNELLGEILEELKKR